MKIACVQVNSGADMAGNIAKVEQLVAQSAGQGALLVALPENVFLMRNPAEKGEFLRYTQEDHPGVLAARHWARVHGIWILVGSVAVASTPEKQLNRSLLIDPAGEITAHYDKIHLFDVTLPGGEIYAESARFGAGGKLALASTPLGNLGMTVCYDVRFPHLYRALAKAGAEILTVPAAFTQTTGEAHWDILLRARAIENGCFVIAPAQTGTHPGGRKTYGHAMIIDPWGKVLADAGTDEGVIVADIDLAEVARVRAVLPSLAHDRDFSV